MSSYYYIIELLHYYMFAIKYLRSNYFTESLNANQPTFRSSLHFLRTTKNVNLLFRNSIHLLYRNQHFFPSIDPFSLLVKCIFSPHFLILFETISSKAYLWLLFNEIRREKKEENTRDSIKAPITKTFFNVEKVVSEYFLKFRIYFYCRYDIEYKVRNLIFNWKEFNSIELFRKLFLFSSNDSFVYICKSNKRGLL